MEPADIFINIIAGAIGLGYFAFGKRRSDYAFLVCGGLLCVYPYIVDGTLARLATGFVLAGLPFLNRLRR